MENEYQEGFYRAGFNIMDSSMLMPCFSLSSPLADWDHQLSFFCREDDSFEGVILEPYFHREEHKGSDQVELGQQDKINQLDTGELINGDLLMDGRCSLSSTSEVHREVKLPRTPVDPLMDAEPIWFDVQQLSEMKSGSTTSKAKANRPEGGRTSCSSAKKTSLEPVAKKPRIEMPSPLPTFNVRKEKLQDRITALQQLVSPFGKTDTASVLHEAIEHIKFLHTQLIALSTPYLRNEYPIPHHKISSSKELENGEEQIQVLKSRGLCLVPISSTFSFAVASTNDFWSPPFAGFYN